MSRPLRIQYPGAWYHVMNRGRRREKIVESKKDCQAFISLLEQASSLFHVQVAAWCIMPHHYHLLVCTPEGNLSRFMRHVDGVYTQQYNRAHFFDGQLFRGRYTSILIDSDHESYLLELVRYIHRNPYKANLEEAIGLYPWSSWEAYTTRLKKWKWVETQSILARFSGNREEQIAAFILFVQGETADEIRRLIETSQIPIALGGRGFLEWIQKTFFDKKHPQIPQSRAISPPRATILAAVQTFYHFRERGKGTDKIS